jgi:hypothetical protein
MSGLKFASRAVAAMPSTREGNMASGVASSATSSVIRELNRIDLHVRHAKEFIQMGLPYSEDLLGELRQIAKISEKAIAKAEEDVKRSENYDPPPAQTVRFDDVSDPLDTNVPYESDNGWLRS